MKCEEIQTIKEMNFSFFSLLLRDHCNNDSFDRWCRTHVCRKILENIFQWMKWKAGKKCSLRCDPNSLLFSILFFFWISNENRAAKNSINGLILPGGRSIVRLKISGVFDVEPNGRKFNSNLNWNYFYSGNSDLTVKILFTRNDPVGCNTTPLFRITIQNRIGIKALLITYYIYKLLKAQIVSRIDVVPKSKTKLTSAEHRQWNLKQPKRSPCHDYTIDCECVFRVACQIKNKFNKYTLPYVYGSIRFRCRHTILPHTHTQASYNNRYCFVWVLWCLSYVIHIVSKPTLTEYGTIKSQLLHIKHKIRKISYRLIAYRKSH